MLAFLVSGESSELAGTELQEVMLGHFTNMAELARSGRLLLAGPFGEPRADPRHRGLFLFDTPDLAEGAAWVSSDPALQAGVLEAELFPFHTTAPVRDLPRLDREDEARRVAEDSDSQWSGREYVLATHADGNSAAPVLAGLGERALLRGRLGGNRNGELLCFLDAADVEAAQRLLREGPGGSSEGWILHPWYGTRMVAALAQRRSR